MAPLMKLIGPPKRVDLHCHSNASNEASEAVLNAMRCPESYSTPEQIVAQATLRGMDFITITDHDSIAGALELADQSDVLVGEEVSCWFPEDNCKMHVLVFGITPEQHNQLQSRAKSIYEVARYIADNQIAHSVAHPLYRNNGKLQRWHVERLLLMFKGFETVNGAHSSLLRDSFESVLDGLTPEMIQSLAERHHVVPMWPEPHLKARTGGSDDHGLLNIGRTWTELPRNTRTTQDILRCLRSGECRPGGSAGAGIKLAHQFYSIAVRYFGREMLPEGHVPSLPTMLLQTFVGEGPVTGQNQLMKLALKHKLKGIGKKLLKPWKSKESAGGASRLLGKPFLSSAKEHIREYPELLDSLRNGEAPLTEHEAMFSFASHVNRDVMRSLADELESSVREGRLTGVFDVVAAAMAQQLVCLPYYFAFAHQNKERKLLGDLTGRPDARRPGQLRIGLFTDTLDEINGVSRFIREMAERAHARAFDFTVHTCSDCVRFDLPNRRNFEPVKSYRLPYYPELSLNIPPVLDILNWVDRQQFDAIEISTPGAMGLMGMLAAQMLRIPVLATYHTDFPAYMQTYTGDDRITDITTAYMKWFYGRCAKVFTRSKVYGSALLSLGVAPGRIVTTVPGIDTVKFNPRFRKTDVWASHGVDRPLRVIYCGRVSAEKNLPLLEQAFRRLAERRTDAALVVVGDGPYRQQMQQNMQGLPAHFLGYRYDDELPQLYASSELCVFPSRTDTLGQVVGEAQASGLPVLVGDEGGPREMMDHGVTGMVLSATNAQAWTDAMDALLTDEALRLQMSHNAVTRVGRFSLDRTFESFWMEHASCVLNNATPVETSVAEPAMGR